MNEHYYLMNDMKKIKLSILLILIISKLSSQILLEMPEDD